MTKLQQLWTEQGQSPWLGNLTPGITVELSASSIVA